MATVTWDIDALAKEIQGEVVAAVKETTAETRDIAREIAPVRTGEYRDGIIDQYEETPTSVTGEVVATAPYSIYVEVGSRGRPGKAVLATAIQGADARLAKRIAERLK